MRVVVDTNVLVSAMLTPGGNSWRVMLAILSGACSILLDERILAEYRRVLKRAKFGLSSADVDTLCDFLATNGEMILCSPISIELLDLSDLPFIEVAATGRADCIVTGNTKHFPATLKRQFDFKVLTPNEFLKIPSR